MATEALPDYVLVHGAFSDASSWIGVAPLLKLAGAKVTTPTLPAHSDADNESAGTTTLADYVATVRAAVEASPAPVILVGHSLAGMVITQVAEAIPEKIAALVYVAAFLPENGRTGMSYSATDPASKFARNFTPEAGKGYGTITSEGIREAVFNESPSLVVIPLTAKVRKEPLEPFSAPATTTPERFGSVPRYYVSTGKDQALTHDLQHRMLAALPAIKVYELEDADHAPFLSATLDLSKCLVDVRKRVGATATAAV